MLVTCLASCGDDDDTQFSKERMSVTDREVVLGATQTSAFVSVDANCQWTAQLTGAWEHLTINPTQGGVNIVSPENTMPQHRSATLIIVSQSGKVTYSLVISQNAAGVSIEITPNELTLIGEEDIATVRVVSNSDWQVSGANEWCHVTPTSGTAGETEVVINVDANPNETSRPAYLVFSAGGGEARQTVNVTQAPPSTLRFATTESAIRATATAGTYEINVAGTATWAPMIDNSSTDWAHIISPQATVTGNGTIVINCDDNTTMEERSTVITLVWSRMITMPLQMTLTQAAATPPQVLAVVASDVERKTATVRSSYTSMFPVKRYGICYTTDRTHEPEVGIDATVSFEGSQRSGDISVSLTNLASGRRYYVRAFAESDVAITYSDVANFTTEGGTPSSGDNTTPTY